MGNVADKLAELKQQMVIALVKCEMYLPMHFCKISQHLLIHVFGPNGTIALCGPAHTSWMYVIEHSMGVMVRSLKSHKGVAKSIMEWYQMLTFVECERMRSNRDWVIKANTGNASYK
jgi:hypothetical protein